MLIENRRAMCMQTNACRRPADTLRTAKIKSAVARNWAQYCLTSLVLLETDNATLGEIAHRLGRKALQGLASAARRDTILAGTEISLQGSLTDRNLAAARATQDCCLGSVRCGERCNKTWCITTRSATIRANRSGYCFLRRLQAPEGKKDPCSAAIVLVFGGKVKGSKAVSSLLPKVIWFRDVENGMISSYLRRLARWTAQGARVKSFMRVCNHARLLVPSEHVEPADRVT